MADQIETLRPNSIISDNIGPGGSNWLSGDVSKINDDSDATFGASNAFSGPSNLVVGLGTFTVPAGAVVRSVTPRVRVAGPGGSGKFWNTFGDGFGIEDASGNRIGSDAQLTASAANYSGVSSTLTPTGASWTQSDIDNLRWFCSGPGWDSTATIEVYEAYVDVAYNNKPTVTVSAPTGTVSTTNRPDVDWAFSDVDSDTQAQYHVKIFTDSDYGSGSFDPDTFPAVWDSTATASSDEEVQVAESLPANTTMKAYVRVNDGVQWSEWAAGPEFDISASGLDKPGRVFFGLSSGPGSDGAGFWEFDDSNREGSFSFKTAPLRDPSGRQVEIREVQVYAKSYDASATVTVTVNGVSRTETIAVPSRQQLSFRFRERGETLDVKVESEAGTPASNEAPSIEALRIGWRPGHQLH